MIIKIWEMGAAKLLIADLTSVEAARHLLLIEQLWHG
jgi:hypothetical protein